MYSRLDLHETLCQILGSRNVYYQPPQNLKMTYPCIVYQLDRIENRQAENGVHAQFHQYNITIIDPRPDNAAIHKMSRLARSRYDRHYVADGLNHDSFTIYY